MRSELKNKVNTIHKSLRFIRTFLNRAKRQGLIKNNVFENYRLKTEPSKREYLSIDELQALEALYLKNLSSGAKNTLHYFLFCCYTGLRYSDVKRLRYKDIRENEIYITMHKTKDVVSIPIIDLATKFIGFGAPNEKIFRVCVSQVANRHLKDIAKLAEINKDISFHCARHTFATFALSKGIPIEVVSKLLGHKEIATTQLYAKIVDGYKREEMKKLVF